jgi:hypothetical protein
LTPCPKLGVQVAQRSELTGELGGTRRAYFAAGVEIAAAEEIRNRNHGAAHGPIFIGSLGPGQFAIEPEIETHGLMVTVG